MTFLEITGMLLVTAAVILVHFVERHLDRHGYGVPLYVRSWLFLALALLTWAFVLLFQLFSGIMAPSRWLDPGLVADMVRQRMEQEDDLDSFSAWQEEASLAGYPLLRCFSLLAPLFVVANFGVSLWHITRHGIAMRRAMETGIPQQSDEVHAHVQTIRILFLPPFYGLMSLQAVSSQWEVGTNHCFASHHFRSWGDRLQFSRDLYDLSFSVADVYEAYALLVFATLIMQVLRQQVTERVFVAKVDTHSRLSGSMGLSYWRPTAFGAPFGAPMLNIGQRSPLRSSIVTEAEADPEPGDESVVTRKTMPLKDYVRTRTEEEEELQEHRRRSTRHSPNVTFQPMSPAPSNCATTPSGRRKVRKTIASFRQLSDVVDDLVVHTKGLTTLGIKLFCITCAGQAFYSLLLEIFGFYDILPVWFGTETGAIGALQTAKAKEVSHIAFYGAGFVASFAAIGNVVEEERGFHHYLVLFGPVLKFLGVKVIVSLAFFQSILLAVLPPFCSWSLTRQNLFYASLLCLECFLISLLHISAWRPDEAWYRETYLDVVETTSGVIRQADDLEAIGELHLPPLMFPRDGVSRGPTNHEEWGSISPPDSAREVRAPLVPERVSPMPPVRVSILPEMREESRESREEGESKNLLLENTGESG